MEQDTQQATSEQPAPEQHEGVPHERNTGMAVVAYVLFFIPLLTDAKDDPFVKFHVKQGFVLFLSGLLASVLSLLPVIMYVAWILHIAVIVLAVVGIMNALNGKQEELPLIGHFADSFHF